VKARKQRKELYLQVRMTVDDKERMRVIANKNGVSLSGQLKLWLDRSWKQQPTAPACGD
jgi:hypothetical protein